MKKLLLSFVILLAAFSAFSQAKSAYSLVVYNQTKCTQYFMIFGDALCACGSAYSSVLISIPPMGTITYANSIPLFGGTPQGIVGAKILNGALNCIPGAGVIGPGSCGLPPAYNFLTLGANCVPCGQAKATWHPAPDSCQETAKLVFTS